MIERLEDRRMMAAAAAPTGLVGAQVTPTSIVLNWTDNAGDETGFAIDRKVGAGSFTAYTNRAANSIQFTDTVDANTSYTYRIKATKTGESDSAWSNEASAATTNLPAQPVSWSGLDIGTYYAAGTSSETNGVFTITSNAGDIENTEKFHYVYFPVSGDGEMIVSVDSMSSGHTWAKAGLMIRESTSAGAKYASMLTSPRTSADGQRWAFQWRQSWLNLPTGTIAAGGSTTFVPVQMKIVRSGDSFTGTYSTNGGSTWISASSGTVTFSGGSSPVIGLAVSSHQSGSGNGNTATFNIISNTFSAGYPLSPTALSGVQAATNNTNVRLAWVDNTSDETAFEIDRKVSGGSYSTLGTVAANVTLYTDTTSVGGTNYVYRVRALRSVNSPYSNEGSISTALLAPTPVTAASNNRAHVITLQFGDVTGETGYTVQRRVGASTSWATLATLGAATATTTYRDSGLLEGTQYHYRVFATNSNGSSAASVEVNATTERAKLFDGTLFSNGPRTTSTSVAKIANLHIGQVGDGEVIEDFWDAGYRHFVIDIETLALDLRHGLYDNGEISSGEITATTNAITTYANAVATLETTLAAEIDASASNTASIGFYGDVPFTPSYANKYFNPKGILDRLRYQDALEMLQGNIVLRDDTAPFAETSRTNSSHVNLLSKVDFFAPSHYLDTEDPTSFGLHSALFYEAVAQFNKPVYPFIHRNRLEGYEPSSFGPISDAMWKLIINSNRVYGDGVILWEAQSSTGSTDTGASWYQIFNDSAAQTWSMPGLPAAPTSVATNTAGLNLTWTNMSGTNHTSFVIERKEVVSGSATNTTRLNEWLTVAQTPAGVTSWSDPDFTLNRQYEYRVRALNAAGVSDPSSVLQVTAVNRDPLSPIRANTADEFYGGTFWQQPWVNGTYPGTHVRYDAVKFATNDVNQFRITLSFDEMFDSEAHDMGYEVWIGGPNGGAGGTKIADGDIIETNPSGQGSAPAFGLQREFTVPLTTSPSTGTHNVYVVFTGTGGFAGFPTSLQFGRNAKPASPQRLGFNSTTNRIQLTWTPHSTDQGGWVIERATDPGGIFDEHDTGNWAVIGTTNAASTSFNYDPGNNDQAYYRVRAARTISGTNYTDLSDITTHIAATKVSALRNANADIQAESLNAQGINIDPKTLPMLLVQADQIQAHDVIATTRPWAVFEGVDFGSTGFSKLQIAAWTDATTDQIEVRLDSLWNEPVITMNLNSAYDPTPQTSGAASSPITGVHNVYLTFKGSQLVAILDKFKFVN